MRFVNVKDLEMKRLLGFEYVVHCDGFGELGVEIVGDYFGFANEDFLAVYEKENADLRVGKREIVHVFEVFA